MAAMRNSRGEKADELDAEASSTRQALSETSTEGIFSAVSQAPRSPGPRTGVTSPRVETPAMEPTVPPRDEMEVETPPSLEDALSRAMRRTSISPVVRDEDHNTDNMELEQPADSRPALNPFAPSTSSQTASTIFANAGKPAASQSLFGQPLQSSTSPFAVSTNAQQSVLFAPAFGQPNNATTQLNTNSDVMMISPEKNATGPVSKSIFERIEKPPADASSSPATTTTAPPPTFSFNQSPFQVTGTQQNSSSLFNAFNGLSGANQSASAPTTNTLFNQHDPFIQKAAPTTSLFNQSIAEQAPQSTYSPQPSSSSETEMKKAETRKDVENKPSDATSSSNVFAQNQQPFASLPSSSSPFSSTVPLSTVNPVTTQGPRGIFGTSANQAGHNIAGTQSSSANDKGIRNTLTPFAQPADTSRTNQKEASQIESVPAESSRTTQIGSGKQSTPRSKPASVSDHAAEENGRRAEPKLLYMRPSPPETWTVQEKNQYITAYRLKQLEIGAKAKLAFFVATKETHQIKDLKRLYRKMERSIRAANGGKVHPFSRSPSPAVVDSKGHKGGSKWSPTTRGERKRSRDEQDDGFLRYSAPDSQAVTNKPKQTRDDNRSRNAKRTRATEEQQVEYPSLSSDIGKSDTSNLFKDIVDKPTGVTNGEANAESSLSSSSVLEQKSSDAAVPNPFASSIAKWKSNSPSASSNAGSTAEKPANSSSTLFAFKPVTDNGSMPKAPAFTQTKSVDFMGQFGRSSKARAKEEMEKRKAEDMDSDEDEAEWERRDAEEQRRKKQKLEEEASKMKPKFTPGVGFTFETAQPKSGDPVPAEKTQISDNHMSELDRQHAEYAKRHAAAANAPNPFAQYMRQDSGNEGSKNGDADDEEDGSDDENKQATATKNPSGGSLFDRISAPSPQASNDQDSKHPLEASSVGINMFGHVSGAAASVSKINANKSDSPTKPSPFGKLPSSTPNQNVFGIPASMDEHNAPGSEKGSRTWNPQSQIKFGSSTNTSSRKRSRDEDDTDDGRENAKRAVSGNAPAVNIVSPSPAAAPSNPIFGQNKFSLAAETPSKTATTASMSPNFGFGISPLKSAPALGSLFPPSNNASNSASRSNSPGFTTGESATESNADVDDGAKKDEQLNLTSGGPGEEDEDILYEVRAKASSWEQIEGENGEKTPGWEIRGLGPFRIMKNRKTNKARMLMRSDPAGRIIINSSIFKDFKYDAPSKSACRLPMLSTTQKLETWLIKVGKEADAADIARILEENKDHN